RDTVGESTSWFEKYLFLCTFSKLFCLPRRHMRGTNFGTRGFANSIGRFYETTNTSHTITERTLDSGRSPVAFRVNVRHLIACFFSNLLILLKGEKEDYDKISLSHSDYDIKQLPHRYYTLARAANVPMLCGLIYSSDL